MYFIIHTAIFIIQRRIKATLNKLEKDVCHDILNIFQIYNNKLQLKRIFFNLHENNIKQYRKLVEKV